MNEYYKNFLSLSSFSKIILFLVLGLIGILSISLLSVRLQPQQTVPVISITYSWPNQNPRVIEAEVTSKIEQSLSQLENLINLSSVTSKGRGNIRLEFSKNTNLDKVSLNISSILRQIYPYFPETVSYPNIKKRGINKDDEEVLMSLNISGNLSKKKLNDYAENTVIPQLAKINGITGVELSGVSKYSYVVLCENSKIKKFHLDLENVKSTIINFLKSHNIGSIKQDGIDTFIKAVFNKKTNEIYSVLNISILNKDNKSIPLKNVVSIYETENQLQGYKRFNGYDALTINVSSGKKENQLTISKKLRQEIETLNTVIKTDTSKINILYDSTVKLKSELNKVTYRILFSLSILLLLIFVINRNFKYVFLVLTSLILNILLAVIFYYAFAVDIHLYSLAGLTISLGIIIDNTIIMTDHILNKKNVKVFIPILAATLTTVGALAMVFFLKKEYQLYLIDFSWVIIINLSASLLVTFFLVPSLSEKLKLEKKQSTFKKKRKILALSNIYRKTLEILLKRRKLLLLFFVLLFGLPMFLIPENIEAKTEFDKNINDFLQSDFYKNKVSPNFKYLGGTLYTFVKSTEKSSFISSPKRLSLKLRISSPEGGTIYQLDNVLKKFEVLLLSINEVDFFLTNINNSNSGLINVFIKKEYEKTDIPYVVKNKLEAIASQVGGMDCTISGVGQPFSNSGNLLSDATIKLKGYNLDNLLKIANEIKDSILLKHPRISKVKINSEKSWILKDKFEYVLDVKNNSTFDNLEMSKSDIIKAISWNSGNETQMLRFNNKQVKIVQSDEYMSKFDLEKSLITKDSMSFSVGQITDIKKKNVTRNVVRKNSNYQVFLDYSFAGTQALNKTVYKKILKEVNGKLSMGYEALHPDDEYYEEANDYFLLKITLVILLIIYFICAILFESLTLPFVIILTIPISFIGVFLTFSLFDIPFDQGGLASFIMLTGIVVNSSIYILNQYINIDRNKATNLSNYMKAFNTKITPIALTIISTILGLLPFVIVEGNDFFWTSFAYGNIGGLLFSFIVILFFLPICLNLKTKKLD